MTMPTQGGAGLQAPSTLECAFTGRVEQAFRPFNLGMRFRRRGGAGLQALQPWNALSPAGWSRPSGLRFHRTWLRLQPLKYPAITPTYLVIVIVIVVI